MRIIIAAGVSIRRESARDELSILVQARKIEGGVVDNPVDIFVLEIGDGLLDGHVKTALAEDGSDS